MYKTKTSIPSSPWLGTPSSLTNSDHSSTSYRTSPFAHNEPTLNPRGEFAFTGPPNRSGTSGTSPPNGSGASGTSPPVISKLDRRIPTNIESQRKPLRSHHHGSTDQSLPPIPSDPEIPGKAYRVNGIPESCEKDDAISLLRLVLRLDRDIEIDIRSLATSQHPGEKVMVVEFTSTPPAFSRGIEEWNTKFKLPNGESINFTIDTHFKGLTVLHSPENDEAHNLE
jgi:hypothetical protein